MGRETQGRGRQTVTHIFLLRTFNKEHKCYLQKLYLWREQEFFRAQIKREPIELDYQKLDLHVWNKM